MPSPQVLEKLLKGCVSAVLLCIAMLGAAHGQGVELSTLQLKRQEGQLNEQGEKPLEPREQARRLLVAKDLLPELGERHGHRSAPQLQDVEGRGEDRCGRACPAALHQQSRRFDLRRIERNPA